MHHHPIYLDYNATTPCDPCVIAKMLPYFSDLYGNPANGLHRQGRAAARAIDEARQQVAGLINARPPEIIFTSGATESNNLAILGLARMRRLGKRKQIVTCTVEHKAVLFPCKKLQEEGYEVTILPVDTQGRVSLEACKQAISEETLLVSIQAANNEVGTLQPIQEITQIAHEQGVYVHCDAAQAIGKVPVDVEEWGVDLLSVSAHKLYGPKGIGCLYMRGGLHAIPLEPLFYGGGQENGLRSGTSNVPGIVGFGEACRLCLDGLSAEGERLASLRNQLERALLANLPSLRINGQFANRLANTSSLTFPQIDADALLLNLPTLMLGKSSACTSGAIEPSHVLISMGVDREEAFSTVRVSMGRFTQHTDISIAIQQIISAYSNLLIP